VGIGVASPVETLEVGGTTIVKSGSGTTVLAVADTSTGGKQYSLISAGTGNVHSVPTGSFYIRNSSDGVTAMTLTSAGNAGFGTSSPQNYGGTTLTVASTLTTNVGAVVVQNSDASVRGHLYASGSGNLITVGSASASSVQFVVSDTERMRLTANGLTFNGDTAAANALDDYEEGTFTAILTPSTSGTITLNATYASFFYTKIGRQVMVSGTAIVNSVSSPVGNVRLEGLPFTSNVAVSNIQAANIAYYDNSATFIFAAAYMGNNVSRITTSIDASTVAAGDEIYFTHTYNV
jgi:hypothetical protein